jgi:hypothetical protein
MYVFKGPEMHKSCLFSNSENMLAVVAQPTISESLPQNAPNTLVLLQILPSKFKHGSGKHGKQKKLTPEQAAIKRRKIWLSICKKEISKVGCTVFEIYLWLFSFISLGLFPSCTYSAPLLGCILAL